MSEEHVMKRVTVNVEALKKAVEAKRVQAAESYLNRFAKWKTETIEEQKKLLEARSKSREVRIAEIQDEIQIDKDAIAKRIAELEEFTAESFKTGHDWFGPEDRSDMYQNRLNRLNLISDETLTMPLHEVTDFI